MNIPKVILHRLNSPAQREREQAERSRGRRTTLHIAAAVVSLSLAGSAFLPTEAVEDYSVRQSQASPDQNGAPHVETAPYLADAGGK